MTGQPNDTRSKLQIATGMLRQGRAHEAAHMLATILSTEPDLAPAHCLLGIARRLEGDLAAAQASLRAALALVPAYADAAIEIAQLLNAAGEHRECLALTAAAAAPSDPPQALLVERARAFQALGLHEERLGERRRIAHLYPDKPSVYHNLAAAMGDAGDPAGAEQACRQAFERGGDAPETWLVMGRALQSQNRFDEAEEAFARALSRRPGYTTALRDWAQLVWMRSASLERALAVLEEGAGTSSPDDVIAVKARLYQAAGETERGYRDLVAVGGQTNVEMELVAAQLASGFDASRALFHARRAEHLAPNALAVRRQMAEALLAAGQPAPALARLTALLQENPLEQSLIALRWAAWRLLDDARASALYDYSTTVRTAMIETPAGWSNLQGFLGDLAAYLHDLHKFDAHPIDQSLRSGSQTSSNLLCSDHPVMQALRLALDPPIRDYLAFIGTGSDVLRSRNKADYRFAGMWSVKLFPGGHHLDHVHPDGWISSAFYVELPPAIKDSSHEGWLRFGQSGIPTDPPLSPEHHVRPQPGLLALFPSYMWHGTETFGGDDTRLSVAFDLIPG